MGSVPRPELPESAWVTGQLVILDGHRMQLTDFEEIQATIWIGLAERRMSVADVARLIERSPTLVRDQAIKMGFRYDKSTKEYRIL